jgi:monoterpene epsilon-lactone hydrolase
MPETTTPSWQSRVANALVRARMRPHALKPIDPEFMRANMGRPRWARELMLRATGATARAAGPNEPAGEWVTASGTTSRTMLYLHGGGYIACSPETHRPLVGALVSRFGARAFVPRYRLAPEHPYPAAFDDALAAYRHLVDVCAVDPSTLVLAGDSAGGGLALALALALRTQALPPPAAILCFSPWTDLAATGKSLDENSDRCAMFAGDTIRRASGIYLGNASATDPLVSPLYGDFRDLAPLLIHASADEVLRDDSVRVAERARAAGVEVEFRMWPVVPHCWQFFAGMMPEAVESLQLVTQFVMKHTNRHVPSVT